MQGSKAVKTKEKEKTAADFQPITLQSLRINTITNFDIYIKVRERNNKERFVLYRKRDIPFLDHARENLADHGTEILYIDASDRKEYQLYLENNLEAIIEDERIPSDEKSRLAYSCATGLVEELLENPRSGENVKRSKTVISNLVGYMLKDSRAFFNLIASSSFDYYTYTHSVNVAVFGIALAHRLGEYTQQTINTIGSGLLLHDIGKSLIDREILNKPGPLAEHERILMERHPGDGVRLLRESGQVSEESLIIVESHHEKLDGSGYPHKLRDGEVHEYARIAVVADIFDALTTERPYRLAKPSFAALDIMRSEMLDGLDRDLFREFVLLLGDRPSRFKQFV